MKVIFFSIQIFCHFLCSYGFFHHLRVSSTSNNRNSPICMENKNLPVWFQEKAIPNPVGDSNSVSANWFDMNNCYVIIPPVSCPRIPKAIIHFVGGFVLGAFIPLSYATMLTELGNCGFIVVATPIPAAEIRHGIVAENAVKTFSKCYYNDIKAILGNVFEDVPVLGLSHSLGGKLTVLMGSLIKERKNSPKRYGNVFLAFNNFGLLDSLNMSMSQASPPVRQQMQQTLNDLKGLFQIGRIASQISSTVQETLNSNGIPTVVSQVVNDLLSSEQQQTVSSLLGRFKQMTDSSQSASSSSSSESSLLEFDPSPEETWRRVLQGYNIPKNVFFRFTSDEIDQSYSAASVLSQRGCDTAVRLLPGNHLTPCTLLNPQDLITPYGLEVDEMTAFTAELLKERGVAPPVLTSDDDSSQAREFLQQLTRTLSDLAMKGWDASAGGGGQAGEGVYQRRQSYDLPVAGRWDDDDL